MFYKTILTLIFCIFAVNINALERCPGASNESQDDFKVKYDTAPIVAYATVTDIKNNLASLKISCTLKGSLPVSTVEVTQLSEVLNLTECHYLTVNKQYVVFLESMKTGNTNDAKNIYRLADMEEFEVNSNTVSNFLNEECSDEEDFGIEMTIFYYNKNLQCGQFTATCNQATKTSILGLNYPPLNQATTFLGGFKKTLDIPKMNPNDDGSISGKSGATGDESLRSTGTMATIYTPLKNYSESI